MNRIRVTTTVLAAASLVALGALVASAQAVDDATTREAIAVVTAIDRAARSGDLATLRQRARFPLAIAYVDYDMEVHVRRARLPNAEALAHRWEDDFAVPPGFLAVAREGLPRTGGPICDDDAMQSSDPDATALFRRGDPAVARAGESALTVTFVRERCGVTQGYAVWRLARTPAGWLLVGIGARTSD